MPSKIEEIILGYVLKKQSARMMGQNTQYCKELSQAIYQAILERMPKEKVIKGNVEAGLEDTFEEKMAYNQTLSDTKQALAKMFNINPTPTKEEG